MAATSPQTGMEAGRVEQPATSIGMVLDAERQPEDTEAEDDSQDTEETGAPRTDMPKSGIMSESEKKAYCGFLAQYFAVGIIYGGLPATIYPVFLGYLNVPSYVYATAGVIIGLPWSFKFFFGLINDTVPIVGLRRKPYMMIGWAFCAIMLVMLFMTPLPEPYWCIDEKTGAYIKKKTLPDGSHLAADPCNEEAAELGGKFAIFLMLAALGYVIADVAADGLLTEYAKEEPLETRGSTQTTAYLTRSVGMVCSGMFVGLFMNSKLYNGTFDWGLSFEQVCLCFAVPAVLMVPISGLLVHEPRAIRDDGTSRLKFSEYGVMCWELLKSKAFFYALLFQFLSPAINNITTTAAGQVKNSWAGVQNFQNQMFSVFGNLIFIMGLWLVKKKFLNSSWRMMLIVTTVFLQLLDAFFITLTVFDVVRNQYFYLGETVLLEVPAAANFVVATFVIVEMADHGNEGLVYGLMTTAGNLGSPVARAIGNQIYRSFEPSISSTNNYIEDTLAFRRTVFYSFLLSYGFAFLSLAFLYFLPRQKAEAQERKATWSRRPIYGYVTVAMLSVAFIYSLMVNFMSMFPSTMCLEFAGGDGCDSALAKPPLSNNSSNSSNVLLR